MSILFVNPAGKRRKVVIRNVRYSKAKEAVVKRLKRTPAAHASRRAAVASMKRAQAKAVVWSKSSAGVVRRKRIEKAQAEILERQLAADRKNQKRKLKKTPRRAAKLVKKSTKGKNLMAKKRKSKKINIKRTRARRKTSRKIARKHKRSHAKRYVTTAADMRARLAAARQVAMLKAQAQAAYKPKKRRKKSRKSRKAARVVKTARRSRRRARGRKQVSVAAMRNRWAIKRRSELRRARSNYGRLGGQISWGKKHDRAGYLLPNPGRKRRRRKLRSNPSRRRRRMRLRRNPSVASIKSALTAVLPTIGGFMVARVFSKKVAPLIPGLNMAGKFADTVVALVGLVAADFATNKVTQLSKYKTGIVAGFALNAVEAAMRALLPESIKSQIGLSDYVQLNGAMYDRGAISDYVQLDGNSMGEYVEMPSDGSSGGGYIDVEQDLAGVRADLAGGVYEELGGLRSQVQTVRRIGGVPAMSYTGDVGMATEEDDASLYTGVFSSAY